VVALTLLLLVLVDAHRLAIAVASGFLGVGVGCTFAAMPRIIVDQVPSERTGSALSLNQVLRSVGGAVGSAASATIIALHHPAGAAFPDEAGYTVALVAAAAACLLTAVLVVALRPAGRWRLAKQVVGR
jgi:MFS family permease